MRFSFRKTVHWPTGPEVQQKPVPGGAMLYDASRAGNADAHWFDRDWWSRRGQVRAAEEGRGAAVFIQADGRRLVLRHYRRGGWMAALSSDRYRWHDADSTRSFHEWYLLYLMRRAGLPVPVPIAASYRRVGWRGYRADLVTEQIPNVSSLASRIRSAALPLMDWVAIGRCLRRFHDEGVCHADLNAHNVLLGEGQAVWLIDFDRAQLRRPGLWCDTNLVRLRRSLEKISDRLPAEHFSDADWASMLNAYFASAVPAAA
jgi:3-deoxy-D-manno-octulosonic acid kinase